MKKSEAIAYINASDWPLKAKAAASIGVSLMPAKQWAEFATAADEGVAMIEAGNYDGVLDLLRREGAGADIIAAASGLVAMFKAGQVGELPRASHGN